MPELFYDCGAYGLFTLDTERWQPAGRGELSDPAGFVPDRASPLSDPVWYNWGPVIKAVGEKIHVVDVGGYIGTFSIPMSECARRAGCELSFDIFEPGPTHDAIQRSIEVNGLSDRMKLHRKALSSHSDGVTYEWRSDGSIGGQVFAKDGSDRREQVASTTIDEFCKDLEGPLLIKLDTQGHERAIMSQAMETISQRKAMWQIEFIQFTARARIDEKRTFAEFLADEFVVFNIRDEVPPAAMKTLVDSLDNYPARMTDLILFPKSADFTDAAVSAMRAPR